MDPNEKYPKKAGVYKFTCSNNGKIYIGKSVSLYNRINYHRNYAKRLKSGGYFQNALIKHGWNSFVVDILETFEDFDKDRDKGLLFEREAFYIKLFDSTNTNIGYNLCKYSTDRTGMKHTIETKQKMRQSALGKPKSQETKDKISLAKKGKPSKPHSQESIEKMRLSKIGKKRAPFSKKARENMSKGQQGKKMSEESKLKISKSSKGRPKSKEAIKKSRLANLGRKASEETRKKMSDSGKGRKLSEEHKQILIQCNKDRVVSPETRNKMREAQKGNQNRLGKGKIEG